MPFSGPSLRTLGGHLKGRRGLALFTAAGLAATALGILGIHYGERTAAIDQFSRRNLVRHRFMAEGLQTYENVLFSLQLLTENNRELEPTEFALAATKLHTRNPGIQALQWAPLVPAEQLPAFVEHTRALVDPAFVVQELGPEGVLRPLQPGRREHAIITYVHPLAGNVVTRGYDILTAPSAPDLARARDTGEITLSRTFPLIQGGTGAILIGYTRTRPSEARAPESGAGFLQVVLRMESVLDHLWSIGDQPATDIAVYDITDREPVGLFAKLADQSAPLTRVPGYADFITPLTRTHDLVLGGRTWRACYRPDARWLAAQHGPTRWLVLAGGLLLTGLAAAFLVQNRRRTLAIRREVEARTAELSDSRTLLDSVIEHSPSVIWVKDAALRYQLVNAEFCRVHRLRAEELVGRRDDLVFADPAIVAEVETADREVLSTGRTLRFEGTYRMQGELHTFLVGKFPLRHADGSIYAVGGVATDITELRRAEAEKALMERRLLETQKLESIGVLAGGIAHDFNNLLTGILGHASLLASLLPPAAGAHPSLAQIENAARRAAELCRQMLAYSGHGRLEVLPVELGALVRETVPLLRASISKSARLHFDLDPALPSTVADITQLRQIVMNLVINASDALGDAAGDITLRTRLVRGSAELFAGCVHAPASPMADYVCLEVADTGCGMDAATLARIFDPFFTTKFAGRGLGLAAVLGIVRGHQGALRVTSAPDEGTRFELYLPASAKKAEPAPAAAAAAPARAARRRLLVVDDEPPVRETAVMLLDAIGYETEGAADGAAALARFRGETARFDAAIIDLTMPGMSGIELLNALRALHPDFPILLMSGYNEKDAAAALATPRTAFLGKPFTLPALREKLSALLA